METIVFLLLLGLSVGILGTFFGVGGGIIIVPVLTLLGYDIHTAVGTSLLTVLFTSMVTSEKNLFKGNANLEIGIILAAVSIAGAIAGGFVGVRAPAFVLFFGLAFIQMLSAILMIIKNKLPAAEKGKIYKTYTLNDGDKAVEYSIFNVKVLFSLSFVNGVLSGMAGVGGGVVIVPMMHLISGIPMKTAAATSAFIVGFASAGSGVIYFYNGYVQVDIVAMLVPAVTVSAYFSSKLFSRVTNEKIYYGFVVLLVTVALHTFYKALRLI